ncbi:MAG: ECF transporter S component [Thermofilum sp.]|jgi:energy-coupling factor transport system substrate-specific component|nr:ECF transporter S component [Thermofilum sp.]
MERVRYTAVDWAMLAVVAVASGIIFWATWFIYDFASGLGGPIIARLVSYGLWFIGAPLAASTIRKPLSAFLGETLGALLETLIPTVGGFTNLIYGLAQGLFSELGYFLFKYKKWGIREGAIAGALPAFPCVALDAILFGEIAEPPVLVLWIIAALVSGAVYGSIAAGIARTLRK